MSGGDKPDLVARFEGMLAAGRDGALVRYGLGIEYLKRGDVETALVHLKNALEQDPGYSAAWKQYAGALAQAGQDAEALEAYRRGIEVAEGKGDMQAAKEMRVFLRRLHKQGAGS